MGRIGLCILRVVPTECDVLIVCRQHNDKEWKFKEQHAKMWENITGAKRYSRPRGFNIAGASAPVTPAVPTPLLGVFSAADSKSARHGCFADQSTSRRHYGQGKIASSTPSMQGCSPKKWGTPETRLRQRFTVT